MSNADVRAAIESLYIKRVRLQEEVEELERRHRQDIDGLFRELIEIADGVERLRAMADSEAGAHLGTILRQLEELLTTQGLSAFRPSVGDQVNGASSEVMATTSRPGLRPGTVTRVLRPGYRDEARVVRRAGVEAVKE